MVSIYIYVCVCVCVLSVSVPVCLRVSYLGNTMFPPHNR